MRRMQVCYRLWIYWQPVDCMIPDSVSFSYIHSLQILTCAASRYENPVITATSRDSIGDIHSLSQYLSELDAPKPTSLLRNLLGLARIPTDRESWFQVSRMWTEVDDVCENESFGESATGDTMDSSIDLCQMDTDDALWSIHSIYCSFRDFMPNALLAT